MNTDTYADLVMAAKKLIEAADNGGIDVLCERIRDLREAVDKCQTADTSEHG